MSFVKDAALTSMNETARCTSIDVVKRGAQSSSCRIDGDNEVAAADEAFLGLFLKLEKSL